MTDDMTPISVATGSDWIEKWASELVEGDEIVAMSYGDNFVDTVRTTIHASPGGLICGVYSVKHVPGHWRFRVRRSAPTIDASRYPHRCPRCVSPAYVGMVAVECSRGGCA